MTMPMPLCRSCLEHRVSLPCDLLCDDCRRQLAEADAQAATREAHEQRAGERALATEPGPVMDETFPW